MGSEIDASHGIVRLVVATNASGRTGSVTVRGGRVVVVKQAVLDLSSGERTVTVLEEGGRSPRTCVSGGPPYRQLTFEARAEVVVRGRWMLSTNLGESTRWTSTTSCNQQAIAVAWGRLAGSASVLDRSASHGAYLNGNLPTLSAGSEIVLNCAYPPARVAAFACQSSVTHIDTVGPGQRTRAIDVILFALTNLSSTQFCIKSPGGTTACGIVPLDVVPGTPGTTSRVGGARCFPATEGRQSLQFTLEGLPAGPPLAVQIHPPLNPASPGRLVCFDRNNREFGS